MLDDLRKPDDEFELDDAESLDDFAFSVDDAPEKAKFMGMTPVERMFISIFLFMNVLVLGLALLLATNRLG